VNVLSVYRFGFTLISISFRAEVRALLFISVLLNIFYHVILCCIAICCNLFMLMLANKINNSNNIPVVVFVIFILCELGVLDFTFSVTTHTHTHTHTLVSGPFPGLPG